jgi:outer membrane lipoprotein-sorting protein
LKSRNGVLLLDESVIYTPPLVRRGNTIIFEGPVVVAIDYAARTWSRGHQPYGPMSPSPDDIRSWVSAGDLKVAGRERFLGVDAIKLTTSSHMGVASALWVDARTYLPLQWVTTARDAHGKATIAESTRYQVLPATAANLALFRQPKIPAGFTRAPLAPLAS